MRRLLIYSILLSVVPFAAAKVELRKSPTTVDIVGNNWKITYGSGPDLSPQLLELSPERAYFTQGGWVRLIDTGKGVVLGRWHVGPRIVSMRPAGEEQVEVQVEDKNFRCKPYAAPGACPELHDNVLVGTGVRVPLLPTEIMAWRGIGIRESAGQLPAFMFSMIKLKPERARTLLPAAEELSRRDPYLPWARVVYAHLLAQAGDPRATAAFTNLLESPGGDFSEWLPISAYLYEHNQLQQARAAYNRGYKDFLQHGFDPRVFLPVWERLALFSPNQAPRLRIIDLPPEQMDRLYRFSPYSDLSWVIWQTYAESLAKQGRGADAQMWRARAADARQNAPELRTTFSQGLDRWFLTALAALLATAAYMAVVSSRYAGQRAADMEAGRRKWAVPVTSNFSYWTRTQRWALLVLVLAGWLAMGLAGLYAAAYTRNSFAPAAVRNGSYVGQNARWHLQQLPASPERDLLLGIAYQQGGDSRRAEETYRKLPQFAESWNNLGLLLKRRGKEDDARQAFQRALQISPQLHEARFNLDGSTPDFWTQLHRDYLPDKPMLAVARRPELRAAYLGGSGAWPYVWSALRGPFWPAGGYWVTDYWGNTGRKETWVPWLAKSVGIAAWVFVLLLLRKVRRDPVSQPVGPRHWIWELLLPGTAPAWSIAGGLLLTAYIACWLSTLLFLLFRTPGIWSIEGTWVLRWYGLGPGGNISIGTSWGWFVAAGLALFAANAAMVLKARRTLTASPTSDSAGSRDKSGASMAQSS